MWILISPWFIKWFTPKEVAGITIFPFIILNKKELKQDNVFVNHELIHIYQQLELFFIPFILWYYAEFFFRLLIYRNIQKAYRNISFEREAYLNETNFDYLKTRKFFSFLKYL